MKVILAKKLEMTQKFMADGSVVPVTTVQAGPCLVTQVKNNDKDGYVSIQLGFGKKRILNNPLKGHLKDLENFAYLREFPIENVGTGHDLSVLKRGDKITAETFVKGETVQVTGVSKGKGFQGVVRRHHFHGHPKSHGHKDQLRTSGSIGAGGVQNVFKGTRMAGRMGGDQVTVTNLEIVDVDAKNNLLFIKGAVPGARNGLLLIKVTKEVK
ncbi:50S ribosomal protein L3 [Candidatus Falkowbacteria bacterium]|nr:50S ribosomal protein L3 [Candidatus Falkowbacteria bacterium]